MWNNSWACSVPLILSTVIIHVIGIGFFNVKIVQVISAAKDRPHFIYIFALGIGGTAIWATFLHTIEAGLWAAAYLLLGALPDGDIAILYSLSAHHNLRSFGTFPGGPLAAYGRAGGP